MTQEIFRIKKELYLSHTGKCNLLQQQSTINAKSEKFLLICIISPQEFRKEVAELHRSLQQLKVESKFLREELRKAGGQSANPAHFMEEKIQLLKEVSNLSCTAALQPESKNEH